MFTLIAVCQNLCQNLLDFIFKKVIVIFRKVLFGILKPILIKRKEYIEERIIKDNIRKSNHVKNGLSILKLASITNTLGVVANNSFEYFYLNIPDEYKHSLKDFKFVANGECDCSSRYYLKLISFLTECYNIPIDDAFNIISQQIDIVAQQFLYEIKAGRQKSNNKMFGVDKIVKRGDLWEIQLFITDYFTYSCINRIYRYLKKEYPLNLSFIVETIDDVNRVSPFLCNFGIGGFLSLNYVDKEVYFVGKRSSSVACPNVWQTSFDETFDLRDKPNIQGESPNLNTCLERGVKEELGFFVYEHDFRVESSLLSVIHTDERFEIELFVIGHCHLSKMKEFEDVIMQMYSAPDFENENEIIKLVPQDSMSSFFEGLKIKGESHTIEALDLWSTFMSIRNMQNVFIRVIRSLE